MNKFILFLFVIANVFVMTSCSSKVNTNQDTVAEDEHALRKAAIEDSLGRIEGNKIIDGILFGMTEDDYNIALKELNKKMRDNCIKIAGVKFNKYYPTFENGALVSLIIAREGDLCETYKDGILYDEYLDHPYTADEKFEETLNDIKDHFVAKYGEPDSSPYHEYIWNFSFKNISVKGENYFWHWLDEQYINEKYGDGRYHKYEYKVFTTNYYLTFTDPAFSKTNEEKTDSVVEVIENIGLPEEDEGMLELTKQL